ncbi:hypothetical protein AC578_1824 [Pseudocercospora eumusae]|uniref:Major facilitator superfamily (MFS) profile domain-containing protein n=1 Tax=Pseudocercospora eumusae TaxID=321146 RepID=A0A139HKK3_9PEZI|nr:hypothetical protein AC578_1824 [Pseudocercospora eumusae]
MFAFHRKSRSLISVRDMEKIEFIQAEYEQDRSLNADMEEEDSQTNTQSPRQRRNLIMIYLLFLAEAIMATSLQSQITTLLPSASGCLTMDTSFLRSILQCAYYFGSASGIMWGHAADAFGRRRIALVGLLGMSACCISMGFATSFIAFSLLRYVAGAISSAATVSALTMLADVTHGSSNRSKVVARLPLVVVCGQMGPIMSNTIRHFAQDHFHGVFVDYPGLAGQISCGLLVFSIAIAEVLLLDETLPTAQETKEEDYADCEKAAFLGKSLMNDSEESLSISIIEALNDDAAAPRTSEISMLQMVTAPSVLLLLASFSILSLHASTFEILLPHMGHNETHSFGFGIPCSWLSPVMLVVKCLAALRVLHLVPFLVNKVGTLPVYRRISIIFPVLYLIIPLMALAVSTAEASTIISAVFNTIATLIKTTLAGAAQVLVVLLVFSAAPDAASTGTLVGVISISELFKALAVGVTGVSYFLSADYSMAAVNGTLWAVLATTALVGAGITWKLRESPRVGTDIPSECLTWQGMFDASSDDEHGF